MLSDTAAVPLDPALVMLVPAALHAPRPLEVQLQACGSDSVCLPPLPLLQRLQVRIAGDSKSTDTAFCVGYKPDKR